LLANATGKDIETIKKDTERDLWLDAKEALAYGLVDKILDDDSNEIKAFEKFEMKNNGANLEKKTFDSTLEIKNFNEDEEYFYFEGYVSDFDSQDFKKDIVCKGAFSRTLKESQLLSNSNQRTIVWNHDQDNPVGVATLNEDNQGLFFKGKMPKADDFVKGKVIPQIKVGSIKNMSFGYIPKKSFYKDGCRNITDIELFEVTISTIPMNVKAKITDFKSMNNDIDNISTLKDINNHMKKCGFSRSETESLMAKMRDIIKQGNLVDESNSYQVDSQILDKLDKLILKTKEK
jgi:HK97 family phage prohead protease